MSEPVGPQYGLKPRRTRIVPPGPTSVDIVADDPYEIGSEFGGVMGIIQPPPHVPTAGERLMMIHHIDPTDTGTEDGSVAAPELEGF